MLNLVIIFAAKYLIYLIIVIGLTQINKQVIKLAAIASLFSFILSRLLNKIILSPRPFVVDNTTQPLIFHMPDNGFPSDHMLLAVAIAAIVFTYNKKVGIVLGVLAIIVGTARVMAKVHHPIDIIGSTLIAILSTYLSWLIVKRLSNKRALEKPPARRF